MERLRMKSLSTSQKIVYILAFIFFSVVELSKVYIIVLGFLQGCKTHTEAILDPFGLPSVWHFENYIDAFTLLEVKGVNFLGMIGNTLWYASGSVVLNLLGTFCITYIISKYKFPGSAFLNWLAIMVLIVPLYGAQGSMYILAHKLNFINSPLLLITKIGGLTGNYLVMKAFIDGLSWTYAEAAFIDGASDFHVMWKINFPQLISPMMAIVLNQFIFSWNEYSNPLIYLPEMPVISVGLHLFESQMVYKVRMDILFAASIIAIIPLWILYAAFNKSLLNLTFGGGIKG